MSKAGYLYMILGALLVSLLGGLADAYFTNKGIKAGVGLEGNPIINKVAGYKPSALVLYTYNFIQTSVIAIPNVLIVSLSQNETTQLVGSAIGFGGLLSDGAKHLYEAMKWRRLINGH